MTTQTNLAKLREAYFQWLINQVQHGQVYLGLLRLMHQREFVWLVPNDDNRLADGTSLRVEYLNQIHQRQRLAKEHFGPCSILEVLISISRRLEFIAGGSPDVWALNLLDNLKLLDMLDPLSHNQARKIEKVLDKLIWRTYRPDGYGGFFPLRHPPEDQTKAEIWYQMAAYVNEIHPL